MSVFGGNIRAARLRRKLTVEQSASLCNVALSTWYGYEAGTTMPTLNKLAEIAAQLKTTAAKLVKGMDDRSLDLNRPAD